MQLVRLGLMGSNLCCQLVTRLKIIHEFFELLCVPFSLLIVLIVVSLVVAKVQLILIDLVLTRCILAVIITLICIVAAVITTILMFSSLDITCYALI